MTGAPQISDMIVAGYEHHLGLIDIDQLESRLQEGASDLGSLAALYAGPKYIGRAHASVRSAGNRATMRSAVSNVMTRRTILPRSSNAYTAVFETTLERGVWGKGEAVHFNRASAALEAKMQANPMFAGLMEDAVPGIGKAVSKMGGRNVRRLGWTWEHASSSTAQGRFGVMRLVPRAQHTPGSRWWRVMHPDEGAAGGYSEWARPAGAPPRK